MTWHVRNPDDYNAEGGPAFGHGDHQHGGHPGMSLRDWFAGQAVSGVLARIEGEASSFDDVGRLAAKVSYAIADSMLAAREAKP